jgi:PTS system nitrogen regulatory IIA component
MPDEVMDIPQVARYLGMSVQDVTRLAARGQLPGRKVRGAFRFRKGDVDHWVETRMPGLSHDRLAEIEQGVAAHHGMEQAAPLVVPLIPAGGILAPLQARTAPAAIRALVEAADDAGLVYDRKLLIEEVVQREQLCSTAIGPGLALPHPRHPMPWDIAASFVILGRSDGGIPFGAEDGSLTRLFMLICCKDERTHLHVLARISRMFDDATLAAVMAAGDAEAIRQVLQSREAAILATE